MKINRVYIDGFRNIDRVDIHLDRITALLSPNSYGKSNLLEAIDFGFHFIKADSEEKTKMMGWKNGFPLNEKLKKKVYTFEVDFDHERNGETHRVIYSFAFEWRKSDAFKKGITHESLKIRNMKESSRLSMFISRSGNKATYKPSMTGRCDKAIKIEADQLVMNKLEVFDDLYYLDYGIKPLNHASFYLDRHFDSFPSYQISRIVRRGVDELSLDSGNDIARVLYKLKQDHTDKFDLITNTIKDMFSFIEAIEIREIVLGEDKKTDVFGENDPFMVADRLYMLFAKHKHIASPINFSQLSDGVRRVLLLLTYIILAEINQVVLIGIEEPENSINPGLLNRYIIALDNFIDTSRVMITSHSPFLVNYIDPHSVYLGVPNEEGIARFKRIGKTKVKKMYGEAKDLDMPFGEYLFDLLSGSKDDYLTLSRYLKDE